MIYAALAILSVLMVAAGGLVWLVDRAYRGDLRAALERAKAAEARADAAEAAGLAAQPDRTIDALATPDSGLLDALLNAPDPAGGPTALDSASRPEPLAEEAGAGDLA